MMVGAPVEVTGDPSAPTSVPFSDEAAWEVLTPSIPAIRSASAPSIFSVRTPPPPLDCALRIGCPVT